MAQHKDFGVFRQVVHPVDAHRLCEATEEAVEE
jgi:hypothetical protein